MAESLSGSRVVITGASSGIGEATARALVSEGATVALGARRADRLESIASELGDAAHPLEVDVSDEAAARSFIESAGDAMGGIDALINNAGVMLLGPIGGADTEEWRRMIG